MAANVPAWKRVGLRLKNQDNDTDPYSAPSDSVPISKKRKLEDANGHGKENVGAAIPSPNPNNVSNLLGLTSGVAEQIAGTPGHEDVVAARGRASPTPTTPTRLAKRKSVTFSADAKTLDGPARPVDSIELGKVEGTPKKSPSTEKVQKRKERRQKLSDVPSSAEDAGHVKYLTQYHNDRSAWKFNKNLQTQILQNAFNLYHLPAAHTPALVEYVAGLQGAAARSRLKEEAEKIASDAAPPSSTDASSLGQEDGQAAQSPSTVTAQAAPSTTVTRGGASDDQRESRLSRAKAILVVLSTPRPTPTFHATTQVPKAEASEKSGKAPRRKRGTKGRALVLELDLSSSDGDSDSDSDLSSVLSESDSSSA